MGIGLSVAMVLASRAISMKRGREFGAAAVGVGLVPELVIVFGLVDVVINAITPP